MQPVKSYGGKAISNKSVLNKRNYLSRNFLVFLYIYIRRKKAVLSFV